MRKSKKVGTFRADHPRNRQRGKHSPMRRKPAVIERAIKYPVDPEIERVRNGKTLRNLCRYARAETEEERAFYEALIGVLPLPIFLSSNAVEGANFAAEVARAVRLVRKEEGMEMAVQTQRFDAMPSGEVELSIRALRSRVRTHQKLGVSSVSAINFLDLPDADRKSDYVVHPVISSLLFGANIRKHLQDATRGQYANLKFGIESLEWFEARKRDNVNEAVTRVLQPMLVGDEASKAAAELAGRSDWMRRAGGRAFMKFQILSMLPMASRVMATGRGAQILSPALNASQRRLKQLAKGKEAVVHPEEIVHRWFAEAARLGLDGLGVPLIKLR